MRYVVHAPLLAGMILAFSSRIVVAALSFSGDVSLNTGSPTGPALVGRESIGSLQLDNGSMFSSGQTQIGVSQSGIGFATVMGPRSAWTMGTSDVGYNGIGTLNVQDGGIVDVTSGLRIGANLSGHGTVGVTGPGSTILSRGPLTVGSVGTGLLDISDGGIVNATQTSTMIGLQGRVSLDGGLLRVSSLNNNGQIAGSGELSILSIGTNISSGRLEAGNGDLLRITGATQGTFENQGRIDADGGEIEFLRMINNFTPTPSGGGEITLRNGTLRIGTPLTGNPGLRNMGLLASVGGENHFYGTIMNTAGGRSTGGEIAITNQSRMIFHDDVTLQGGMMTVFPGSKATLLEDLSLASGATLLADIAGSSIDTEYGEIEVVGNVMLGGLLDVVLSNGFTPAAGDSFQILTAYGGVEGSLALAAMPPLPNRLGWDLAIEAHRVVLNVVALPDGDYNGDGMVDAADYTVWRDSLGQVGDHLPADGDGSGTIDGGDYGAWAENFGAAASGAGSGSAASSLSSVPEPASWALVGICIAALAGRRAGGCSPKERERDSRVWPLPG
jgi:T5SS/PEP-CTERM-associated repeat protein